MNDIDIDIGTIKILILGVLWVDGGIIMGGWGEEI
jgi:hypothetical protein